jgi:hypothetical protein
VQVAEKAGAKFFIYSVTTGRVPNRFAKRNAMGPAWSTSPIRKLCNLC